MKVNSNWNSTRSEKNPQKIGNEIANLFGISNRKKKIDEHLK